MEAGRRAAKCDRARLTTVTVTDDRLSIGNGATVDAALPLEPRCWKGINKPHAGRQVQAPDIAMTVYLTPLIFILAGNRTSYHRDTYVLIG